MRSTRQVIRRKSPRSRKSASFAGPSSATTMIYRGPIWTPGTAANRDIVTTQMVYQNNVFSNAAGICAAVFDQTMTGLLNWATYAALYDEYRVLGCQLEYYPANRYSKAVVVCTPGVGVVDRDSNGALTSLAQGFGYASCRVLSLEDPWTDTRTYRGSSLPVISFRMDGVNDATWITTAAPIAATKPAIKLYFTGLTASTTYGLGVQRMAVQFRGRV